MRIRFCLLVGAAAYCFPAFAQSRITNSSVSTSGNSVRGSMHLSARPFAGTPVTGAPYFAQRVSEHVQTSADGTRFTTNNRQETVYRDSQGRTRTERPMMGPNGIDAPLLVEISDPVANVGYTLDTQNKVAHRVAYSTAPPRPAVGAPAVGAPAVGAPAVGASVTSVVVGGQLDGVIGAAPSVAPAAVITSTLPATTSGSGRPRPEVTHEDLGSQLIEGVMAEGHRSIQTWPVGSQGNDRPFQTTSETWFSPELKVMVLNRNIDPRSGENTTKLINIDRAEPSSNLFQPPPEFTIVDETGPFEIPWTGTRRQ